jgi:TM2 domain
MKKITLLCLLAFGLQCTVSASQLAENARQALLINISNNYQDLPAELKGLNTADFLKITPAEIKERTGHKLSLREAIQLRVAQKAFKKALTQEEEGPAGNNKSQLTALILAMLLGFLGIHRFYLGHIGLGILQLLTCGGCLIWYIIDVFRIADGTLKPKKGEYDPKL